MYSTTSILGAISIHGVVKITVMQKPNPPSSKKRRLAEDEEEKKMGTGTNTNHYVAFLLSLMNDEWDKFNYSSIKGAYLVMNNAPIHGKKKLTRPSKKKAIIASIYLLTPLN